MKKLYILLAIVISILLITLFPYITINPGKLAEAHQKLNNKCFSCHQPFSGIANENCISCHVPKDIGKSKKSKQKKTLFHLQLSEQKCNSCHTEHKGLYSEYKLSGFKHELLSKYIINNCNSCHSPPTDNFHNITIENCNKCHSTLKWVPSTFDHSEYFKLDQNHSASCNTCHSKNNFGSFTCYGCHEHAEPSIIAEHNEEGIYNISNCVSCHKSGNEHDIKSNTKNLNETDDD